MATPGSACSCTNRARNFPRKQWDFRARHRGGSPSECHSCPDEQDRADSAGSMTDDATARDRGASASPKPVAPLLRALAGWTWRLLILALPAYLFVGLLDILAFVVLPFFPAMLAAA